MRRALPPVLIVLALAACGSGAPTAEGTPIAAATAAATPSTPTATPAPPDACSLLTKAEAETLAGTPLNDPTDVGKGTYCQISGPTSGPVAQVEIFVGDGAKQFYDTDHDTLKHTFTSVPGLGDEAYEEDGVIFFRKSTVWVAIHLTLLSDPAGTEQQRLVDAAKKAAARF